MNNQKKSEPRNAQAMLQGLQMAQIHLDDEQLQQLWKFHTHLRNRNEELNMTRIHSFSGMLRKHYIDCLLVPIILEKHNIRLKGRIIDIGSGPGFPGIPLAIYVKNAQFILAEGRQKRVEFLGEVVDLLKLQNTEIFGNRVHSGQNLNADFVITRAVEKMKDTIRHSEGNTKPDALYVFMKGPNCDDEIQDILASNLFDLILDEHYTLPESDDQRRLVVWQKKEKNQIQIIESSDNKKFKFLKQLLQTRYIKKHEQCIVSGTKIIMEVLQKNPQRCMAFLNEEQMPVPDFDIPVWSFQRNLFGQLDTIQTNASLMLYSLKDMPEFSIDQNSSYIALPLQNPKNLGSAIRSARAFGFNKIILFDASAHFAHPETIRASVGLSLSCSYSYFKDIDQLLENSSCNVYGLSGTGSNLSDLSIRKPALIIVGEEGRGLTPHPGIQTIRIEIEDDVESLNASTALSIFLYKYYTN